MNQRIAVALKLVVFLVLTFALWTRCSSVSTDTDLATGDLTSSKRRQATFDSCYLPRDQKIEMTEYTYKRFHSAELKGDFALRAYVFYPPRSNRSQKLPAVALFHGGGWIGGTPTYYFPMARYLASRGIVAVTFQYRLQEVFGTEPEQSMADAVTALRWVHDNAKDLGINSEKIAALGDSAGGQLVLSAEMMPIELLRPAAVLAFYPAVDTRDLIRLPDTPIKLRHPSISPELLLEQTKSLAPTLILHGTKDDHPWATYEKSEQFCKRAIELGTICKFLPFEDRKHAFLNVPADYRLALSKVDDFLTAQKILFRPPKKSLALLNSSEPGCQEILKTYDELRAQWGMTQKPAVAGPYKRILSPNFFLS